MKIKPLGDRVVILPTPQEKVTSTGLIIPDMVKEKPNTGTVVSVGPGSILVKGDFVIFMKHAGIPVNEYIVLREPEIIAYERPE